MSVFPNMPPPPKPPEPKPDVDTAERTPVTGVPRRFGVGTLLVITAMYAVLFAVLRAISLPPIFFVFYALFFTAVGLGQMLLFQGKQARRASAYVGAGFSLVASFLCYGAARVWELSSSLSHLFFPIDPLVAVLGGMLSGYLVGVLIAGVFLVMDRLGGIWRWFCAAEATADAKPEKE